MKFLIVNADDFGYSYGVNKGIVEAHVDGIVTSTSVLVDAIAANEAKDLARYKNLSVGLHFDPKSVDDLSAELDRQIEKFIAIVGRDPDHIDTHKRHTTDKGIQEVLRKCIVSRQIPIREFGYAKFIRSFGVNSADASIEQLERSIDQATDDYNEIMCHVGYCDNYLKEHSSYNDPREQELKSLCTPQIKEYLAKKEIQLINWRQIS